MMTACIGMLINTFVALTGVGTAILYVSNHDNTTLSPAMANHTLFSPTSTISIATPTTNLGIDLITIAESLTSPVPSFAGFSTATVTQYITVEPTITATPGFKWAARFLNLSGIWAVESGVVVVRISFTRIILTMITMWIVGFVLSAYTAAIVRYATGRRLGLLGIAGETPIVQTLVHSFADAMQATSSAIRIHEERMNKFEELATTLETRAAKVEELALAMEAHAVTIEKRTHLLESSTIKIEVRTTMLEGRYASLERNEDKMLESVETLAKSLKAQGESTSRTFHRVADQMDALAKHGTFMYLKSLELTDAAYENPPAVDPSLLQSLVIRSQSSSPTEVDSDGGN